MDEFEAALSGLLPRLRRFAHGLAGNPADADDLVQQAAERALRSRAQWQSGTSLAAWTFRIMRNQWIDTVRSRQRRDKVLAPAEAGEAIGAPPEAEARADLMFLMRAMDRLPDEQREAVALVMIEGFSYAEAAAVMEVPVGTLTSRLVRGRQALLAMLEAE